MAISDDQLRQTLGKYVKEPWKIDNIIWSLGQEHYQNPDNEADLRSVLAQYGVPAAGVDAVVQTAHERGQAAGVTTAEQDFAGMGQEPTPAMDFGAHGGGTIEGIAQDHGLDVAGAYMTPEERAQFGAVPDFSGIDFSKMDIAGDMRRQEEERARAEAEQKAAAARQADLEAKDKQFGHDLSWLDPMFQQDPTKAITEAQKFGTSADPELVKQQQSLVDEVRGRGLTADQSSRDAQQRSLDELMSIYNQGGQTARDRMLRAKARADSENWLRGQREADMQSLAERGMSGSGAEVLSMLGDRQDAASRLSAADLQASADAEQRALDALLSGTQVAKGMESSANAYQAGNTAAAGGMLGDMRSAADAYQRGNADMIAQIGKTNTDYLRQAQSEMLGRRNDWDKTVLGMQTDMAKYLADRDARENAAGWGLGYQTAGADTAAAQGAQDRFNAGTQGAFTGQTPQVRAAGQAQTGYTGEAQAHAGQAFSGAANFVGNLFSGLYGGGGGGGNSQTTMSQGGGYTPAGEQTGMDKEYR